jgi:hypothetical protein
MTDNLITPPPELINRWKDKWFDAKVKHIDLSSYLINEAARWGAVTALRAAADQVVPDDSQEAMHFTTEAIRLNKQSIRRQFLTIAAELEGANG